MANYKYFQAVVKPKPEYESQWSDVPDSLNPNLNWLRDDFYHACCQLQDNVKGRTKLPGYLEFRGTSRHASIEDFLDVIEELEDFLIIVYNDDNDIFETFVAIDTKIQLTGCIFNFNYEHRVISLTVSNYIDEKGDEWELAAPPTKLEQITVGPNTFLSTDTIESLRWNAYNSKYIDELITRVDNEEKE